MSARVTFSPPRRNLRESRERKASSFASASIAAASFALTSSGEKWLKPAMDP